MNCRKTSNLLSAYIDGELAGVELLQIRQHLRVCGTCSDEHDTLLSTKRLLSTLSTGNPRPDFEEDLIRAVHTAGSRSPRIDLRTWWTMLAEPYRDRLRTGVAAVAVFAALAMWATVPLRMPAEKAGLGPGFVAQQAKLSPAPFPVGRYMSLHSHGEDASWISSGPTISPAADVRRSDYGAFR